MIHFTLNGESRAWDGDGSMPLLAWLREQAGLTAAKDGCSGQGACGACLVELDGKPALACTTPLRKVDGRRVVTLEGLPAELRLRLGRIFVAKGAVQCGFCTPGLLMRTKLLLEKTPRPTRAEIVAAVRPHLCRCTGYVKIVEAIEAAAAGFDPLAAPAGGGRVGTRLFKHGALETATGERRFSGDLSFPGMRYGALKFSDHPRARVRRIDTAAAERAPGVRRVVRAGDVPGVRVQGLIVADWPLLVAEGETTRTVADVLLAVVADSEAEARRALELVRVEYEPLEPVLDTDAALAGPVRIHDSGNRLEACRIRRGGDAEAALASSAFVARGVFHTQMIEHAFLETEAAVARPWGEGGVEVFSQGQGVYEDRRQIASLLGLSEEKVNVVLVPNGGGFGGKEDLTVQGHAALLAWLLGEPVRVRLSRPESIRMHPKRHPFRMDYAVGCDRSGQLTALRARIVGDTGAYASVGGKVLERAAGHASGAYHVPVADVEAQAVYTNNLPCGAMRGFGVNQVTFAMESCIDMLCEQGGFDRWQFRWDNALAAGRMTAAGQVLEGGVGVRACLEALRDEYRGAAVSGLACGIKNTGIGNGICDESQAVVEVLDGGRVRVHHGWTEMGQGIDTVAVQVVCQETGIDPCAVSVQVETRFGARAGMTTASRGTSLLAHALRDACRGLREDLRHTPLAGLAGRRYRGHWKCDWTTAPGQPGEVRTHYSYGYAAQLAVLDDEGRLVRVTAAHDAGRVVNPTLFEGQIQGSVAMGLGYALSEELRLHDGAPASYRLGDLGLPRAGDLPLIEVVPVEVADPHGPYGAKGVGEIGLVPTAAAVANAFCRFDGERRFRLPLKPVVRR